VPRLMNILTRGAINKEKRMVLGLHRIVLILRTYGEHLDSNNLNQSVGHVVQDD